MDDSLLPFDPVTKVTSLFLAVNVFFQKASAKSCLFFFFISEALRRPRHTAGIRAADGSAAAVSLSGSQPLTHTARTGQDRTRTEEAVITEEVWAS